MDKASIYADRVIWLEQGRIVAMGTPAEIKKQMMEHIRKMPGERKLRQGEAELTTPENAKPWEGELPGLFARRNRFLK